MKSSVGKAGLELSSEGICKMIAFCCTVGSVMGGIDLEREIINLIEKKANTPAITTATAVKASFDALKVKKIAIATPYYKATNQSEKEGFERQGYHVTKIMGYHESAPPRSFKNEMIGRLLPEVAYKMGMKVNGKEK